MQSRAAYQDGIAGKHVPCSFHCLRGLGHGVEGRAVLEPLDLALVEGVGERDVVGGAVGGVNTEGHGLADGEFSAEQVNLVVGLDLVVVLGVGEGEREHTLLLQVGLVDTSEGAGDDGETTEVAGLESGVLTGRALTVVPVTDDDPPDALGLVVTGSGRDSVKLASGEVLDLVGLAVGGVDGTDQHVVGDVVKVTTVLEPRAGHGDVVGGGLALGLDEDGQVGGVLAVPGLERLEELETVGGRGDSDADGGAVGGRGLVRVRTRVKVVSREASAGRLLELELLAVLVLQGVGEGVEVQGTGERHGDDKVGGGDERVSGRVAGKRSARVSEEGWETKYASLRPVKLRL